jgi:hypothetical protein
LRGCDEPSPTDYPGVVTGADDLHLDTPVGAQFQAADLTLDNLRGPQGCIELKYVRLQSG